MRRRSPASPSAGGAGPRGASPFAMRASSFPSKYKNKKVVTDEGTFDSQREYKHWLELKIRERAGEISRLERQKDFVIEHNGVRITKYRADFIYFENGQRVVADSKGFRTDVYRLKAKLMKAFYNIEIREM